jgi:ribosomal protein S18 acetylase RimI-like enzyme
MELFIRPAGPADAEEIAEVQRVSWHAAYAGMLRPESLASVARVWDAGHWRASLERTDDRIIPLVLDGRATGVAGFGIAGRRRGRRDPRLGELEGEIYLLYLLPAIQRQGHGARLTAALARVLLARGMNSALVWALAANDSAIAFYRRMGGAIVAEARKPFFGEMVDEVALGWPDLETLIGASRKVGE